MDSLFRKHDRLLANTSMKIVRDKMDEIHWNTRLVSILGAKGVGKSTLIRQYLKQHFKPGDRYNKPFRIKIDLCDYTPLSKPFTYGIDRNAARGTAMSARTFKEYCNKVQAD